MTTAVNFPSKDSISFAGLVHHLVLQIARQANEFCISPKMQEGDELL